jgi:DNA-binding GntR family transcriptional regulator
MDERNKKVKLSAQVEETLRNRILNLEYPHHYILVEEALCNEFSVSRSPVREALRMLEASGMIHRMKNRSYVVKQISQTGVKELYEVRLALEKYVVEKLCHQEDSDELVQLLIYWQNFDTESGQDLSTIDRHFHETLAEIYGNKTILDELRQINDRLRVFREVDFAKSNRVQSTKEQHLELLKAIHSGDVVNALKYIEININEGLDNAIEALKQAILRAYER